MFKLTTHKNPSDVAKEREQRWRKGNDAMVELLHFDKYLSPNSTSSNERFHNVSNLKNTYTIPNNLESSNASLWPIMSNSEHYKIIKGQERDFENLQNLNQDALTVSRSRNRLTMEKGKRKKVDKSIDERGCKMPKVVKKEECNYLNGIHHEPINLNISNINVCQLREQTCQQVQMEEASLIDYMNKNKFGSNDEILISQDMKKNQKNQNDETLIFQESKKNQTFQNEKLFKIQNLDSHQSIPSYEALLAQNLEVNHPLHHDKTLKVYHINQNQSIQDDKESIIKNINKNNKGTIYEDPIMQNMNENQQTKTYKVVEHKNKNKNLQLHYLKRKYQNKKNKKKLKDPSNNCIDTEIKIIKENNRIKNYHLLQDKSDSNAKEISVIYKDVKDINVESFLTCEKKNGFQNIEKFSTLDKLVQSDFQSKKSTEGKIFTKEFKRCKKFISFS